MAERADNGTRRSAAQAGMEQADFLRVPGCPTDAPMGGLLAASIPGRRHNASPRAPSDARAAPRAVGVEVAHAPQRDHHRKC
jgi:hypothetical protein